MRRSHCSRILLTCLSIALLCNRADATLFYNLEEDGTGTVLATLHLAGLPADHTDVLGLTFTPAGESIFGFGPIYPGTFDDTSGHPSPPPAQIIDDGLGGLGAFDNNFLFISDSDPPPSTVSSLTRFSIVAHEIPGSDALFIDADPDILAFGDWRVVPEPTTSALVLATTLFFVCRCRGSVAS